MSEVKPLVAIHCLVYNHEPYLRDCFEGFVMQQTNFPFVAIVHDDASTDGSVAIIREYEAKYPHIFKPIYEDENLYQKGGFNAINTVMKIAITATGAKYIAMCEGDDYWIDSLKLQKQVDFMEANPRYVLCCHRYKIYDQNNGTWSDDDLKMLFEKTPNGFSFSNKENLEIWTTKTMTLLIRYEALKMISSKDGFRYWRDAHMNYYLLKQGNGYCLPIVGAVCTYHNGGVYSSLGVSNQLRINLKVWNELATNNKEDEILIKFYEEQHNNYRNRVRYCIQHSKNSELFSNIKTLLKLDFHYGGIKMVIFSCRKLLLSMLYNIKR